MNENLREWIDHQRKQGKSENTLRAYRNGVQHLLNHFPEVQPLEFIPRDILEWRSHQQSEEKAAPSTINTRLSAVRAFFSWLMGEDSPARDVSNVSVPKKPPQALTDQQQRRLLRSVSLLGSLRDQAIIEVLLGTGLRVEELLALQLEDVFIRERSGKVIVREGKGGKYREVPLPKVVRQALSAFLSSEHPHPDQEKAYLWTGQRGPISDPSTIFRMLSKYAYHAKMESFGPHVLRHTYAHNYLEKNPGDIRGLADLLGHDDINTTMKYTQTTLEDLQERVENL